MKRVLSVLLLLAPTAVRAEGVAHVMTAKSIPASTVRVIDPETGTSQGSGGASDVKVAVGDVISFRFRMFPVGDGKSVGMGAWLTDYIPNNTEVVGVRILADDTDGAEVIRPRYPGISNDGCSSGAACTGAGTISQVHGDVGMFYTKSTALTRNPSGAFIRLDNGLPVSPKPNQADKVQAILGLTTPLPGVFAHNAWDEAQAEAFGAGGEPPWPSPAGKGQGSPVAGPDAFYTFDNSGSQGPWSRIQYPGSLIGRGLRQGSEDAARRMVLDASTMGHDVRPNNPLPWTSVSDYTRAVRMALGDIRVGKPVVVEVSLRVKGVPIDTIMDGEVNCGEVFGGDTSLNQTGGQGGGAANNPWGTFVPSPGCVFLNLLFDLRTDDYQGGCGNTVPFTLDHSNLSIDEQENAVVYIGYSDSDGDPSGIVGGPLVNDQIVPIAHTIDDCPPGPLSGLTCIRWDLGDIAPGADFRYKLNWQIDGCGALTNVLKAHYVSDQLASGFVTQAITLTKTVAVFEQELAPQAASVSPGNDVTVSGTLRNDGKAGTTMRQLGFFLPEADWTVKNVTVGGTAACTSAIAKKTYQSPTDQPGLYESFCTVSRVVNAKSSVPFSFVVTVPSTAQSPKLYPIHTNIWADETISGSDVETFFADVATVPVGQGRTPPPTVNCPDGELGSNAGAITGTAVPGSTVRIYFDGILRGTVTADGSGNWSFSTFTSSFGSLYGGIEIRATAQASGELESEPSALEDSCVVVPSLPACADGEDNDGDDLFDFPDDPCCSSLSDPAEDDCSKPQCSDGDDNDSDGRTDWALDTGCYGVADNSEVGNAVPGAPACVDGSGSDYPDNPFCHSANDEVDTDPAVSSTDLRPRLLFVIDTSGSMNFDVCGGELPAPRHFIGDGTTECPNNANYDPAVCPAGGTESRLSKVKEGMRDVIAGFGEAEYGLMRFRQAGVAPPICPSGSSPTSRSWGWQGGGAGERPDLDEDGTCGRFNAGEVLVEFSLDDNRYDLLEWMDNNDNWPDAAVPPGLDFELRGSGTTPLAGSLASSFVYLADPVTGVRTQDDQRDCREYRVILLTDGRERCSGNPQAAAGLLAMAGIKVNVIGFATNDDGIITQLNSIADAGGTTRAIFVDDSAALSAAISEIIAETVRCNDECRGGAFPVGDSCNNGLIGKCARVGSFVCDGDFAVRCDGVNWCTTNEECGASDEVLHGCNRLDDNCNGFIDEGLICNDCPDEVCNGVDDDCNDLIDDGDIPGVGDPCGIDEGACIPGVVECRGAMGLQCIGATTPTAEECDNEDNDCDGIVDDFSSQCYPDGTAGCEPAPAGMVGFFCQGLCRPGVTECTDGVESACEGLVTPTVEICNGLDDDCDGEVDEDFNAGAECSVGVGACRTTGLFICAADGMSSFCTAPIITGSDEICDGLDNDCDGSVDEGDLGPPIGQPCGGSAGCGEGVFVCDPSGTIVCTGGGVGTAEVCDGVDNDCDGFTDEPPLPNLGDDCPPEGLSLPLMGECRPGTLTCVPDGTDPPMKCLNARGPTPEICDGKDNDCDGNADDFAACPSPTNACVEGTCVIPCTPGEIGACPFAFRCRDVPEEDGTFCLPFPCDNVICPGGMECDEETITCKDKCENVVCPAPRSCFDGRCVDCFTLGCPDGQICRVTPGGGECQVDRCRGVTCDEGEFCRDGACLALTCTPECAAGSVCVNGQCQALTCDLRNCEGRSCPPAQACNPDNGLCIPDPCQTTECPNGFSCSVVCGGVSVCTEGTPGEEETKVDVLATGGGGFSCEIGAVARGGGRAWWLLLVAIGALVAARRRSRPSK
jgi:hypothetical protein